MQLYPKIAMIADDLTGALDSVVTFANVGLRCVVATAPAHLQAALEQQPEVVAVSTNSRDLSMAEAIAQVSAVATALKHIPMHFKKIDSRLKGHIAAEITALVKVQGQRRALLCPAIPQMGRLIAKGQLRGFGIGEAIALAPLLADLSGLSVAAPDVISDSDIDAILAQTPAGTLLIGARGLAEGVARRMALADAKPIMLPLPRPMVFVIGSRDPITLAQVAALRQSQPQARFVPAPNGQATEPALAMGIAILQAISGGDPASAATVSHQLAKSYLQSFATPACVVLTGGETAAAVLAEMQVGLLEVLGEALPGMPLCRALGFQTSPLIVTKSGGFGAADALSHLAGGPAADEVIQ